MFTVGSFKGLENLLYPQDAR